MKEPCCYSCCPCCSCLGVWDHGASGSLVPPHGPSLHVAEGNALIMPWLRQAAFPFLFLFFPCCRWGAAGFGFMSAGAAAAGRQAARPFAAALAAYRRRQGAALIQDGPTSPALSRRVSAKLDVALAQARSIGVGMRHAHGLMAGYAFDGKGHMSKLMRLPSLVVCVLRCAKLVIF